MGSLFCFYQWYIPDTSIASIVLQFDYQDLNKYWDFESTASDYLCKMSEVQNQSADTPQIIPKLTSSVHNIDEAKPPFGSRFLTDESKVWSQNAWDHVPPPDDQDETIAASLAKQNIAPVPEDDKFKYNEKPARHWDNFYKANSSNFFRNRKWLHNEFPELVAATQPEAGPMTIAEIGCGAGNAVFPLIVANQNPHLTLRAYDYSTHAVKIVQADPLYLAPPVGTICASVWDLTTIDGLPPGVNPESVDIVILIFVLSALHPDEWGKAVTNIHKMLKPGGLVLFRDYGRYDLTQLRFKAGRLLDDNFYIRGDNTRVYFFELDELALLFTGSTASATQMTAHETTEVVDEAEGEAEARTQFGVGTFTSRDIVSSLGPTMEAGPLTPQRRSPRPAAIHPNLHTHIAGHPTHPLFAIEQLGVDRRLIVNRKRQLKMYRVWMQGKFRKL